MVKNKLNNIVITFMMLTNLLIPLISQAKDLGVIGEIYPIVEVDFLTFIQNRIIALQRHGQFLTLQKSLQQQALHYRDRPMPVAEIYHAKKTKSWLFDPSIIINHDIVTPEGKVFINKGTRINPLVTISLTKTLILYDADDPMEVSWVKALDQKLKAKTKLILVRGSVLSEEKHFKRVIYFDQNGVLTRHFQIKHVPALIEQEGLKLRITEVKV